MHQGHPGSVQAQFRRALGIDVICYEGVPAVWLLEEGIGASLWARVGGDGMTTSYQGKLYVWKRTPR